MLQTSEADSFEDENSESVNQWKMLIACVEQSGIDDNFWGLVYKIPVDSWRNLAGIYQENGSYQLRIIIEKSIDFSQVFFSDFCSQLEFFLGNHGCSNEVVKILTEKRAFIQSKNEQEPRQSALVAAGEIQKSNVPVINIMYVIASFLTIEDLTSMSHVSLQYNALARAMPIPTRPQIKIPFGFFLDHLYKFQLSGLHGASSYDAASLYSGVQVSNTENNFGGRSQLGPGFYLTEGVSATAQSAAEFYAANRVGSLARKNFFQFLSLPAAQVFEVYTKNLDRVVRREVPPEKFWNLEQLEKEEDGADILTSKIDSPGYEHGRQIKVNARALEREQDCLELRILPQFTNGAVSDTVYLAHLLETAPPNLDSSETALNKFFKDIISQNPDLSSALNSSILDFSDPGFWQKQFDLLKNVFNIPSDEQLESASPGSENGRGVAAQIIPAAAAPSAPVPQVAEQPETALDDNYEAEKPASLAALAGKLGLYSPRGASTLESPHQAADLSCMSFAGIKNV